MIDVTGQKWDNNFLAYIINNYDTWTLRDYYLAKIKKELAEYNADPKNNPPLKDENGKRSYFPLKRMNYENGIFIFISLIVCTMLVVL